MKKRSVWVGLVPMMVVLGGVAAPAAAQTQKDGAADRLRLGGFVSMGFGGEATLEEDDGNESEDDLDATGGFGFLVDFVPYEYVGVGGLLRFAFWEADGGTDRNTVMDFSLMPRGRYPFERGEVYLAVPVGMTIQLIPDQTVLGADVDIDAGVGWNVGLLAGGQFLVTDNIGVFGHMGGMFRGAKHGVSAPLVGSSDVKVKTRQFVLELGVSFLL
ncbi:MAG: hypothetical protein ACOCV4_08235 [Myxococcota bacterium]